MSIQQVLENVRAEAKALPATGTASRLPLFSAIGIATDAIKSTVSSKYPKLMHYWTPGPTNYRWDPTADRGTGGWVAWRSNAQLRTAAIRWADLILSQVGGRISEVYGLGAGADLLGESDDSVAEALVLASLRAIGLRQRTSVDSDKGRRRGKS